MPKGKIRSVTVVAVAGWLALLPGGAMPPGPISATLVGTVADAIGGVLPGIAVRATPPALQIQIGARIEI